MEKAPTENEKTAVPGQITLPGLGGFFAYESQKLSNQEETFCWELVLNGQNLTKAYQKAYPNAKATTARSACHALIAKHSVINRIAQIQDELKRRRLNAAELVVDYHARVLSVDREDFYDESGKPLAVKDLSPLARSVVDLETSYSKHGSLRLAPKVPDRQKSAAELARIQGLYKDKMELFGKDGEALCIEVKFSD